MQYKIIIEQPNVSGTLSKLWLRWILLDQHDEPVDIFEGTTVQLASMIRDHHPKHLEASKNAMKDFMI